MLAELASHFPIIQNAAPKTQWRFLDFFTATIQNPNAGEAYARAVRHFFTCCDLPGVRELGQIKPFMVAAYVANLEAAGRQAHDQHPSKWYPLPGACEEVQLDNLAVLHTVLFQSPRIIK